MKVIVTIQHPAHVHFFRHAIRELKERGHRVYVFAREKEMAIELLERFGIEHEVLAGQSTSLSSLAAVQATYEARLLRRAWRIKPDVMTAIGGVAAAHVASAMNARSVVFYDTEHATLIQKLAFPFADAIYTPDCFTSDVGPRQVRYPGYHELAYLHPDRFTPDPTVVEEVGADPDDSLVVCRLVEWGASHDVGNGGFDDVDDVVGPLESADGTVLITSERPLPEQLEPYRVNVAPDRMHDLLASADLFVGEGATMAAESAVLGTPAVYVNSLSMGYTTELQDRYGLLYHFHDDDRHVEALERAVDILGEEDETKYEQRRERLLADKQDTTDVVVDAIESGRTMPPVRSVQGAENR